MLNLRRLCASGSRLWNRPVASGGEVVSRRTFTMVDSPTAAAVAKRYMELRHKKMEAYGRLFFFVRPGPMTDDLDEYMKMEGGKSLSPEGLMYWAKKYKEDGEHEHALEIFEWMERNNMSFSPSEHAIFLELIDKIKGIEAAQAYFDKIDPNFNKMDPHAKNWPAYQKLIHCFFQEDPPPEEFVFHPDQGKWVPRRFFPKLRPMNWVTQG